MQILTGKQRYLLMVILVLTLLLLANSAYLFVTSPEPSPPFKTGLYQVSPYGMKGIDTIADAHPNLQRDGLSRFYQYNLVFHVAVGFLLLALALVFTGWHSYYTLFMKNKKAVRLGIAVLLSALVLGITGFFILTEANSIQHRWIFHTHQVCAIALPLLYIGHRWASVVGPAPMQYMKGIIVIIVLFMGWLFVDHVSSKKQVQQHSPLVVKSTTPQAGDPFIPFESTHLGKVESPFFPSPATTTSGVIKKETPFLTLNDYPNPKAAQQELAQQGYLVEQSVGAETCARCHLEIVNQWKQSVHRFSSFNNPFYKASVDSLRRQSNGKKLSQWCAACHDPVLLFSGQMMGDVDPHSMDAQAGLTCLTCHAVDSLHGKAGNGNYNLDDITSSPYLFASAQNGILQSISDSLVKSKPHAHKSRFLKSFHRQSEFCLTCHKVSLDQPINNYRWLRGQNEYDAWHDSGVARNAARTFYLPDKARTCQDCHMAPVPVETFDVSAKNGQVKSHRFFAVHTALPYLRGDERALQQTEAFVQNNRVSIDLFAYRFPQSVTPMLFHEKSTLPKNVEVEIDVVVRNRNVGHSFPGGTNDSNEAWISLRIEDEEQRTFYQSGALSEDGFIDPQAHFYKVIFVDKHSQPALKRDPQHFHTAVYTRTIGPGTANVVRYRFTIPPEVEGQSLHITARLLWRKFNRHYTDFVLEQEKDSGIPRLRDPSQFQLPVTLIDEATAIIHVNATHQEPTPPSVEWHRYNDYGIAYLLQGDLRLADWAFEAVSRAVPERIDGYRNRARVAIMEGRLEKAYKFLNQCEKIEPGNSQTAYFWGLVKKEEGLYEEAVQAFKRVLAYFPEDRASWRELGRTLYLDGQYEESLQAFLKVLAIDPENRIAHYHRMLCYQALGMKKEAQEAEKAYRYYQVDESAAEVTQSFRLKHPHINRASQPLYVYELKRVQKAKVGDNRDG